LFPSTVAHYSIRLAAVESEWQDEFGIKLPSSLASAAPKRCRDFLAGRYCARQALRQLAPELADQEIRIGPGREPIWPDGVVGSITHSGSFASAAAARKRDVRAIGIDSERLRIMPSASAIEGEVLEQDEVALLLASGIPRHSLALLGFSAKESLFKCLYPEARMLWEFRELELTAFDARCRAFASRGRSARASAVWPRTGVSGTYLIEADYVHTSAIVFAAAAAAP